MGKSSDYPGIKPPQLPERVALESKFRSSEASKSRNGPTSSKSYINQPLTQFNSNQKPKQKTPQLRETERAYDFYTRNNSLPSNSLTPSSATVVQPGKAKRKTTSKPPRQLLVTPSVREFGQRKLSVKTPASRSNLPKIGTKP